MTDFIDFLFPQNGLVRSLAKEGQLLMLCATRYIYNSFQKKVCIPVFSIKMSSSRSTVLHKEKCVVEQKKWSLSSC